MKDSEKTHGRIRPRFPYRTEPGDRPAAVLSDVESEEKPDSDKATHLKVQEEKDHGDSLVPIPVIVTEWSPVQNQRRQTSTTVINVGKNASRLVSERDNRFYVHIKNTNSGTVYISEDSAVSQWIGFPLAQNDTIKLESQGPIWAVLESGAMSETQDVHILSEYIIPV